MACATFVVGHFAGWEVEHVGFVFDRRDWEAHSGEMEVRSGMQRKGFEGADKDEGGPEEFNGMSGIECRFA